MPKAVADTTTTEKKILKSCPPDGFVCLRRMTYGTKLQRQQMVSQMRFSSGKSKEFAGEMDLVNAKVAEFEFAHCIVEHNLEDENGKLLDFSRAMNVRNLDPRIGEEISELIGEMNNFDDEEEDETFPSQNESVLSNE